MTLLLASLKSPPPASDASVTTGRSFSPIAFAIGKTAHIPSAHVDRPRPRQASSTSTATTGRSFSPIAPAIGHPAHTRSANVDRPRPRQVSTSTVTTGRSFSPIAPAIGKAAHSRFADVDAARLPPVPRVPRPNRFRDVPVRPVSCSLPTKTILKGILKKSGAPSVGRRAVTWMEGDVEEVKVVDRWIKESEDAFEHVELDPTRIVGRIHGWASSSDGEPTEISTGTDDWPVMHVNCERPDCNKRSLHMLRQRWCWSEQLKLKEGRIPREGEKGYGTFNAELGFEWSFRPSSEKGLAKDVGMQQRGLAGDFDPLRRL
ncbi:MAG: hypothetical protein Q9183_005519 [Haloplaca sp. 2 TL-2023]